MFDEKNLKGAVNYVPKNWGWELWIANNERYCGKILFIKKNKKFSWHRHALKAESFYCSLGKVILYYGYDDDINKSTQIILEKGHSFHVPVGMNHRLEALEDTEIFECSSQHFDEDSIRILKGD